MGRPTANGASDPGFTPMADELLHPKLLEMVAAHGLTRRRTLMAGAGQGALEYQLLRRGMPAELLSAVDIDPSQYRCPGLRCVCADIGAHIPFDDASFGLCIASEVIEHLENPTQFIREAHRVLAPGGHLLVSTPNVHSVMQKLRWLATDSFGYFREGEWRGHGHLHPIFDWLFKRLIHGRFELVEYSAPSFHLRLAPRTPKIPVPWRNRFFCNINIYLCRRA